MAHSFLGLVVFERRCTCVHYDGVELERTPLLQDLERPVPGPQRRVRVPPIPLLLQQLLVVTSEPPVELVLILDLD
jgi:hypothetical protein